MKKNRRGFTLIETLLVSTFVIGTLIYLFVQFSNIKKNYDISFERDTIPSIFYVKNINSYLLGTDSTNITRYLETHEYMEIESCSFTISSEAYCDALMQMANVKKAIVVKADLTNLKKQLQETNNNPFSEKMYQYILSLSNSNIESPTIIVEFLDGTIASLAFNATEGGI